MDKRIEELSNLRSYTEDIEKDLTMILQSLQWDRKHILQHSTFVTCKYDPNHRVLLERSEDHERECLLRCNGYNNILLPEPQDTESNTLIKLSKEDISQIIDNAAKSDPTFKRGVGSEELPPQTLARLQTTYSADERRAIHDAVVRAAPACHDLTDLALTSFGDNDKAPKSKSRTEILAELRDMRRRRTKYRVAAKSTNYSDVLRDVIKLQMEVYGDVQGDTKPDINELNAKIDTRTGIEHNVPADDKRERYENRREVVRRNDSEPNRRENKDKRERRLNEQKSRDRKYSSRERSRDNRSTRDHRYREPSIDNKFKDDTDWHKDRYKETKYTERSKDRTYERRDSNRQERPDRDTHRRQERRRSDREKPKEKDKPRDTYESNTDLTDLERARYLIVEIKREIEESVERSEEEHGKDGCTYTGAVEIKNEKRFIDTSKSESRRQYDRDDEHRSRHKRDREHSSKEKHRDERADMRSKRKHEERRDERVKHKKYEDDSRKESDRSRSADEVKNIRTEDKHKIYYEVYKEINK